jgi:hypothetical protein
VSRELEKDLPHLEPKGAGTVNQNAEIAMPPLQPRSSQQIALPPSGLEQVAAAQEMKAESGVGVPSRSLGMYHVESSPQTPTASQPEERIGLAEHEVGVTDTDPGTHSIPGYGKLASLSVTSAIPGKKVSVLTWAKAEQPPSIASGQDPGLKESGRLRAAEIGELMLSTVGLACFMIVRRMRGRMRIEIGKKG